MLTKFKTSGFRIIIAEKGLFRGDRPKRKTGGFKLWLTLKFRCAITV